MQVYATKNKFTKAAVYKLFNNCILKFGFPTQIHNDRGAEFNYNLFRHLN